MGINKPNVRFVIHQCLPKSLEAFYQEAGRAGRDGRDAYSIVLVTANDHHRLLSLINEEGQANSAVTRANVQKVYQMMIYCLDDAQCRRQLALSHFGEKFSPERCQQTCDNCRSRALGAEVSVEDVSWAAKQLVDLIKTAQEQSKLTRSDLTKSTVILELWRGNKPATIKSTFNPDKLSGFGGNLQRRWSKVECLRVIYYLVSIGILDETPQTLQSTGNSFRTVPARLSVGPRVPLLVSGKLKVTQAFRKARVPTSSRGPSSRKRKVRSDSESEDEIECSVQTAPRPVARDAPQSTSFVPPSSVLKELIHSLHEARSQESRRLDITAPSTLLREDVLESIALACPLSIAQLHEVEGVGTQRRYSIDWCLPIIREVLTRHGLFEEAQRTVSAGSTLSSCTFTSSRSSRMTTLSALVSSKRLRPDS